MKIFNVRIKRPSFSIKHWILLPLVILTVLALWFIPIEGLTVIQQRTVAIFAYAALMWMFEIIPAWATSVSTIVLLLFAISNKGFTTPEMGKLVDYKTLMAAFADPTIMLFLGGFVLAIAASKVGLDLYLARVLLKPFGTKPKYVLLGFLVLISVMSMFMSNTATAAMMLAFLAPVIKTLPPDGGGRMSLAMAIPIAANIGGLGTPIGTPPNAIAIGQLKEQIIDPVTGEEIWGGTEIGFGAWMMRMVPVVIIMITFAWFLLRTLYPFKAKKIEIKIEGDVKKDWHFWVVTVTFLSTILLWMTGELTKLNSNIIALLPFAIFAVLGIFKRDDFSKVDWHVLWMVAGGFALGTALNKTELASVMVNAIPFGEWSAIVVLVISGLVGWLLSNFIANSSAANLLVPILAIVGAHMSSLEAFGGLTTLLVCIAASTSFAMLFPISTPPNAIACSTGLIKTNEMMKVGLIIGITGIALSYGILLLFPF